MTASTATPPAHPRSPSPSSSTDDDPLSSRLHLPPHQLASPGAAYEGDPPAVLSDALFLRPAAPSRAASWSSILSGRAHHAALHPASHTRQTAPGSPIELEPSSEDSDAVSDGDAPQDGTRSHRPRRSSHSRSKSRTRTRTLKWYQRPSPIWFFPGTFLLAVSTGMILAPKLEIYTQLICRAMPIEKSRVTAPPPIFDVQPGGGSAESPIAGAPIAVPGNGTTAAKGRLVFEWSAHSATADEGGKAGAPAKDGDSWSLQCQKSAPVQSAVAQLALVLSLMMGILSSLTTGWWGAFSDRRGRKPVLLLALFGTVMMDSVFLLTVHYHHILSYNFLFVGPFLDGLVGGFSTAQATVSAYLSDCTTPGSRARVFSLLGGSLMGGFALGPLLGSALITLTGGHVLAPFYAALALHCAFWAVLALVLPESLSEERQLAARKRHEADKLAAAERAKAEDALAAGGVLSRAARRARRAAARPFAFLAPVALLLPRAHDAAAAGEEKDEDARTNLDWGADLEEYWHPEEVWRGKAGADGGKRGRDWGLTKVAGAYACNMALTGALTVKLLYARTEFGWAPTTTGYFLSYTGFLRLLTLLLILPLAIKLLRRRPIPTPLRPRPLNDPSAEKAWDAEARWLKIVADSHFDLSLARSSLAFDLAGFVLFLLSPVLGAPRGSSAHVSTFLVAVLLQSLGSGASPAIQSLALAHASPRDAGRLFASLSVVQALAAQVASPIAFAAVFSASVGRWSEGIFALAAALSVTSLLALGSVRLRRVHVAPRVAAGEEEGVAVEGEGDEEEDAPPARTSKSSILPQSGFSSAGDDDTERGRERKRRGSAPALYRD
ncbi:hypothetical protein JCM10450v2_007640 [Rhodotorula kratochvilovae]